jgi:hypothetical protein
MKKLLFNFSNITQFNEQFKLVELIRNRTDKFEIFFLINEYQGDFNLVNITDKINEANCKYFFTKNIIGKQKSAKVISLVNQIVQKASNILFKKASFNYTNYFLTFKNSLQQIASYEVFLKQTQPDILIVAEDGIGSNLQLIRATKKVGIKTMILPYEYSSKAQLIFGAQMKYLYLKDEKGLSQENFEQYYFNVNGKYYGFYSKEEVKAFVKSMVLPHNVKTVHGGYADKIASESDAMSEHYLKEGIPEKKLELTGSVNDDLLYNLMTEKGKRRREFFVKNNLNEKLPLLLFSFIPEYPNNLMFGTYKNYLLEVGEILGRLKNFNVIYQFHPAVKGDKIKIAIEMGLKVSELPTIELIALSDLYVTSYSSTIRWAIAAKVPVIHLDLYGFNYDDFKKCEGIKFLYTHKDFVKVVDNLNESDSFLNELRTKQVIAANRWGILDGKSGDRIINLIENLCL